MTLRFEARPLALSRLAELSVNGHDWYEPHPRDAASWKRRANTVARSASSDWLSGLAPAFDASGAARERLTRAASGGIVVTTGQQPGLFGGPLYTWHKAFSALAFADHLETVTGLPVAPVFWAATDDADVAEASFTVVSRPGGAEEIRVRLEAEPDTPLSHVPLGDTGEAMSALTSAAGSASDASVLRTVADAYSPRTTVGAAYVVLLRRILEPLGVAVLDASHRVVRERGHELLARALTRARGVSDAVAERTRAIEKAGMTAQVRHVSGRTLVFDLSEGKRKRVKLSDAERLAGVAARGTLSPNVLLRPVLERQIMPTVAYVAGPAEISYFAQVSAVAAALAADQPISVPRLSGFVIEPHVAEALSRLGCTLDDLRDPHSLESRLAREEIPEETRTLLDRSREHVAALVQGLASARSAPAVSPPVAEGAGHQLLHKVDRLERRIIASIKRRGSERLRDAATARGALFPMGAPQERLLNGIPLMARHGAAFTETVLSAAREHARTL